jgi:hypothetical protein
MGEVWPRDCDLWAPVQEDEEDALEAVKQQRKEN